MVNKIKFNRTKILELLFRADGQTLSGVKIAQAAGISRVAVWKHINALKEEGIPIASQPKGYALAAPEDLLYPFCFRSGVRERIFHYHEVETTMDTAKDLARQGAPHLSCCVAEHQTRGRGRLNRNWVTVGGGLWFTLILKPDLPPPMVYIYNFAASLSLSRVINRLFDLKTTVKWPNDLLLEGKKLTGLLSEMETQADLIKFLVIGIGVNINNDPSNESFEATSLKNVLGKPVSRRLVLTEFLDDFEALTRDTDIPGIMSMWKGQTSTIGTRVRVETQNDTVSGTALDVDDTGTLIVETDTGQIRNIIYGDCFYN